MSGFVVYRMPRAHSGKDENNDTIEHSEDKVEITPWEMAPGTSAEFIALGRNGQDVQWTLYFPLKTELTDDDCLEIAGTVYEIRVLTWRSRRSGRGGLVVLATHREG